jgi:hypothetical protein
MEQREVHSFFARNWGKILIGFLFIISFICIGLLFGLKQNVNHQDALFKGNANPVSIKEGNNLLLYTYDITSTPLSGVDKFSGSFNVDIISVGIPNVNFRVLDEFNNNITGRVIVANLTDVPFTSTRATRVLKLYVDCHNPDQNLNSINVFINYSKTRY